RNPAAEHVVGDRELARFVVEVDDDVAPEIRERNLRPETRLDIPDLGRPDLEIGVVRDAALERDGVVFGAPRRFAAGARIAALAVLHDLGRALEHAHLADARDIAAALREFHAELEVLVGIEALVLHEFGHFALSKLSLRRRALRS